MNVFLELYHEDPSNICFPRCDGCGDGSWAFPCFWRPRASVRCSGQHGIKLYSTDKPLFSLYAILLCYSTLKHFCHIFLLFLQPPSFPLRSFFRLCSPPSPYVLHRPPPSLFFVLLLRSYTLFHLFTLLLLFRPIGGKMEPLTLTRRRSSASRMSKKSTILCELIRAESKFTMAEHRYGNFSVEGEHVNGQQTLGENIAGWYIFSGPFDNISSLEFNNLQQNATLTKSCTNWIPESSLVLSSKTSICLDNGGLKAAFRAYRELQEGDPTRGTHIFQVSWFRERATFVLFLFFVLGLVQHIIGLFFPPALDCWDREPEEYYWPTMWISRARPFDNDILFSCLMRFTPELRVMWQKKQD